LEEARDAIADLVEEHLDTLVTVPFARPGSEFHFASNHYLALPGEREVWTPQELREGIPLIPLNSLFYHFHESRLRGEEDSDDFSRWLRSQFGESRVVERLRGIDFYFYSLEDLRRRFLAILDDGEGAP
jgi:hypothetical protein